MGKNVKVLIGLLGVIVLAMLGYRVTGSVLVGGAVLVVGILAGVVVLRRIAEGEGRSGAKSNELLASPRTVQPPTAEPLATWTPPPSSTVAPPLDDDTTSDTDAQFDVVADDIWSDDDWGQGTWERDQVALDENPLDDLEHLDEVDVVAEVERLEQRDASYVTDVEPLDEHDEVGFADTLTTGDSTVVEVDFEHREVNEAVSSADDIMEASRATELTAEPDNSELARLLAKVQARLATYE